MTCYPNRISSVAGQENNLAPKVWQVNARKDQMTSRGPFQPQLLFEKVGNVLFSFQYSNKKAGLKKIKSASIEIGVTPAIGLICLLCEVIVKIWWNALNARKTTC